MNFFFFFCKPKNYYLPKNYLSKYSRSWTDSEGANNENNSMGDPMGAGLTGNTCDSFGERQTTAHWKWLHAVWAESRRVPTRDSTRRVYVIRYPVMPGTTFTFTILVEDVTPPVIISTRNTRANANAGPQSEK